MKYIVRNIILVLCCVVPYATFAQSLPVASSAEEMVSMVRGKVVEVIEVRDSETTYSDGKAFTIQTLNIEIIEGDTAGTNIVIEQDYLGLEKGDRVIIEQFSDESDVEYRLVDFDRKPTLILLVLGFVLLILVFSGWQGARSLVSLAGSFVVILYVLVPLLVRGFPPILTSVSLATLILAIAIFFTHGFNKRSLIAFLGTVATVLVTGLLASLVVNGAHLTGFVSDEATFLDFNTNGTLNFVGLLLSGIIIGVLGVLDDIAITQVAVVRELYALNTTLTPRDVFVRAIRVGKEHVSALVNTLVLAYVGVSLPLLLYVATLGVADLSLVVTSEIFATEIARTIIGSIGLILCVPLTTFLAAVFLQNTQGRPLTEKEKHEGCAHAH